MPDPTDVENTEIENTDKDQSVEDTSVEKVEADTKTSVEADTDTSATVDTDSNVAVEAKVDTDTDSNVSGDNDDSVKADDDENLTESLESDSSTEIDTSHRSEEFAGKWHGLVSTTNWEKGRIIQEWRDALIDEGAPATTYSDDAWSQIVGAVTPQHVGRLRRVYDRFKDVYGDYKGLYWSHFHAAIEWEDAEMWLEGAVQNKWSVSQVRKKRWETLGEIPDQKPVDPIVASEVDEDVEVETDGDTIATVSSSFEAIENLDKREPATEAEAKAAAANKPDSDNDDDADNEEDDDSEPQELSRPFENLPDLPSDVADAFEAYKLVIIRHKLNDWEDISRDDMLMTLDSLKALVVATSGD